MPKLTLIILDGATMAEINPILAMHTGTAAKALVAPSTQTEINDFAKAASATAAAKDPVTTAPPGDKGTKGGKGAKGQKEDAAPAPAAPAKEPAKDPPAATAGAPTGAPAEAPASTNGAAGKVVLSDYPMEKLTAATKLKDILRILMDAGFKSAEQLIPACEALKDKLPVLARVANLKARIPTAIELMDE